jgi:hypothetical protein
MSFRPGDRVRFPAGRTGTVLSEPKQPLTSLGLISCSLSQRRTGMLLMRPPGEACLQQQSHVL